MARQSRINKEKVEELRAEGWTLRQMAEYFGVTESGISQALRKYRLTHEQLSHKEWIPWPLANDHRHGNVATNIRRLSTVAQGKPVHLNEQENRYRARSALNWADKMIKDDHDYDYNRDTPPNDFSAEGGFFLVDVPPGGKSRIKELRDRAVEALTRV